MLTAYMLAEYMLTGTTLERKRPYTVRASYDMIYMLIRVLHLEIPALHIPHGGDELVEKLMQSFA